MRLQKVQEALNTKKIPFEYTEEDGCGSIDFMFRVCYNATDIKWGR